MSHLPEITQQIAKSILDRFPTACEAEDCKPNDAANDNEKINSNEILKESLVDSSISKQMVQSKIDSKLGEFDKQQSIANQFFIKNQSRKLKLLYPNFTDNQIQSATTAAWNKLSQHQKQVYYVKCQQNNKQQLQLFQQLSQHSKNSLQQKRNNIKNTSTAQIIESNESLQVNTQIENSIQNSEINLVQTSPPQIITQNIQEFPQSQQASTCGVQNEENSQNLDVTQKYVMVQCQNFGSQEQKITKQTTFVVNFSHNQNLDSKQDEKTVRKQTLQNQEIQINNLPKVNQSQETVLNNIEIVNNSVQRKQIV